MMLHQSLVTYEPYIRPSHVNVVGIWAPPAALSLRFGATAHDDRGRSARTGCDRQQMNKAIIRVPGTPVDNLNKAWLIHCSSGVLVCHTFSLQRRRRIAHWHQHPFWTRGEATISLMRGLASKDFQPPLRSINPKI
jgi:hypothetical protein